MKKGLISAFMALLALLILSTTLFTQQSIQKTSGLETVALLAHQTDQAFQNTYIEIRPAILAAYQESTGSASNCSAINTATAQNQFNTYFEQLKTATLTETGTECTLDSFAMPASGRFALPLTCTQTTGTTIIRLKKRVHFTVQCTDGTSPNPATISIAYG
ncbi:MAG: hypothetical protein HY917_04670 [Candidatus Diapherotrites archaeon]|nr:hypothetical protein [Candidatus Diapherotrites archaeon]